MTFNSLIPELSVKDIVASKKFYLKTLGFILGYERVEDNFAFVLYNGTQIMLEQINGNWETGNLTYPFGRGVNFQIKTDEIDELRNKIIKDGYKLFEDIYEASYRQGGVLHNLKEFLVQDPDGYLLRFSQTMC
jgi:hypothetical protein